MWVKYGMNNSALYVNIAKTRLVLGGNDDGGLADVHCAAGQGGSGGMRKCKGGPYQGHGTILCTGHTIFYMYVFLPFHHPLPQT